MYQETMVKIYDLMNKGEAELNENESVELVAMSVAAEIYEDQVLGLKPTRNPIL